MVDGEDISLLGNKDRSAPSYRFSLASRLFWGGGVTHALPYGRVGDPEPLQNGCNPALSWLGAQISNQVVDKPAQLARFTVACHLAGLAVDSAIRPHGMHIA
jgi:hypothetical protein